MNRLNMADRSPRPESLNFMNNTPNHSCAKRGTINETLRQYVRNGVMVGVEYEREQELFRC